MIRIIWVWDSVLVCTAADFICKVESINFISLNQCFSNIYSAKFGFGTEISRLMFSFLFGFLFFSNFCLKPRSQYKIVYYPIWPGCRGSLFMVKLWLFQCPLYLVLPLPFVLTLPQIFIRAWLVNLFNSTVIYNTSGILYRRPRDNLSAIFP